MIVVCLNNQVFGDFALHSKTKGVSERCAEATVDAGRKNLCGNCSVGQSAKWSPEKEPRRFTDGSARLICILLRTQPRQLLDIRDIDHRICRNQSMSGTDHSIQSISANKLIRGATTES